MRFIISTLLFSIIGSTTFAQNAPAIFQFQQNHLKLSYNNRLILDIVIDSNEYIMRNQSEIVDGRTTQVISISKKDMSRFNVGGEIFADPESIACQSEPLEKGLKIVRHAVGPDNSLLNNAVYNRSEDWLLSIDANNANIAIMPQPSDVYSLSGTSWSLMIRFRPHYFQQHRGLSFFNPQQYHVWKKPIIGWCSWFAYLDGVTEQNIRETAETLSSTLKPYGLEYLQIDDGYQKVPIGLPDTWLNANSKFPSGMKQLATYIKSYGLKPGIWTNVSFADSAAAIANKQYFVKDEKNNPAYGNWIGYVMDGSNPEAINKLITPVYEGLRNQGWEYFKLDALRHLKYEGYNSYKEYFTSRNYDRTEAFRNVVKAVRQSVGSDVPLLACWGIRPELIGVADACRIGNDGFSYAGLAQYNSYNNIIWRNDPDHIELSEKEAYRSCTVTSLTGSLFMVTDKQAIYHSPIIEAAKRCIPVLYTQPAQVYDVDPSRSNAVHLVNAELSGSGPRIFDAGTGTITGLFMQEINMPYEKWVVLGRLDDRDKEITTKDLGLDDSKEYLLFEFWTKKFIGAFTHSFTPGTIDEKYNCQVFCIREKTNHPQLLATSRHISCGAVDIKNLQFADNRLTGTSEVVPGEPYFLYMYEPPGTKKPLVICTGATLVTDNMQNNIHIIELKPSDTTVNWKIQYSNQ